MQNVTLLSSVRGRVDRVRVGSLSVSTSSVFLSHSGQDRADERRSAAIGPDEVAAPPEKPDAVWRPALTGVAVTDVTLNSLTVTFREARVPKGFFRD